MSERRTKERERTTKNKFERNQKRKTSLGMSERRAKEERTKKEFKRNQKGKTIRNEKSKNQKIKNEKTKKRKRKGTLTRPLLHLRKL